MGWDCRMFVTDCGRCTRIRLASIPSSPATCSWWLLICPAGHARFGRVPSIVWTPCWRGEADGSNPAFAPIVGRSPWTAADALVGLLGLDEAHFVTEERVQGDPRRPGGLPHG